MLPLLLGAQLGMSALNAYQSHSAEKANYKQALRQQAIDNKAVEMQANVQQATSLLNYKIALDGLKQDTFETEVARMQTISAARAAAGAAGVNGSSYDQTLQDINGNANRQKAGIEAQADLLEADLRQDLIGIEARRVFGKSYAKPQKPSIFGALGTAVGTFSELGGFKGLGKGSSLSPKASGYISSVQASRM